VHGPLSQPLFNIGATSISAGSLLLALAFLVGLWWLAGMLERTLLRVASRRGQEPGVPARVHMLSRLLR
jgi:small-conductance mechanosensitive channel